MVYYRNGGANIGLVNGATYKVRLLDSTSLLGDLHSKFQLLDTANNDALVELTASSTSFDMQYFIQVSDRVSLGTAAPTSTQPQFFHRDFHLNLDASVATGSSHSLRLALDPTPAAQDTHGLGKVFTADSSSVTDSDADGKADTIDLGYNHGYTAGQAVLYTAGLGQPVGGLSEGMEEAEMELSIEVLTTSRRRRAEGMYRERLSSL